MCRVPWCPGLEEDKPPLRARYTRTCGAHAHDDDVVPLDELFDERSQRALAQVLVAGLGAVDVAHLELILPVGHRGAMAGSAGVALLHAWRAVRLRRCRGHPAGGVHVLC